jgi:hypothetical protein
MDDNTAPEKNILLTNPYICSVVSPEKSIQLAYFRLSDKVCSPLRASTRDHPECEQKALFKGENRWLSPYKTAKADMFGPGDEAIGELHYDKASGLLIALSAAGAYAATPDGEVQWHNPELIYNANAPHQGWQYSPAHRFFYRFMNDEYCATILNRSLIYRKVSQYC